MLQLTDGTTVHDEIETYLNARYISASEAFWRIYNFPLHQKYPPVEKLPCHLPGEQVVLFEPDAAANTVQNGQPITKLTAFFTTNATDKEAKNITYPDFPRYFTWNASKKAWQRRKHGTSLDQNYQFVADTIGRIPTIALTPHQSELYYLRMLLHHKPGPCSYEDIRTIDDTLCPTFRDTCNKLGLISDDNEINLAMTEASSIKFGNQLRYFFTTLLMYCRPADPPAFWEKWQVELSQDFLHRDKLQIPNDAILNEVLLYLQRTLDQDNLDLNRDFNLPSPDLSLLQTATTPRVIQEETDFDTTSLTESLPMQISSLNNDQQVVYQAILESVNNNSGKMFYLNASGGTGKTYVLNILLNTVRANKDIALATALSGIAATLLHSGRTLHSRCKVPINIQEHSTCNITTRDATAELLRRANLLIIDEVSMGHRYIFECIDRSLQDIRGNPSHFGGLTVVFAGDWKQILPVVRRGSRPQIVNACLKKSEIWQHVHMLNLTQNMRTSSDEEDFAAYLMTIGNGLESTHPHVGPNKILIPDDLAINADSIQDLTHFVFNNLTEHYTNPEWMASRAIIAPTNKAVEEVNANVIHNFPSQPTEYRSCDTLLEDDHQYPLEFINSLNPSELPPHKLNLKTNCTIMLLW
ncbi:uncharacterized protein LOC135500954 [Lineus longissimus]|uniref:uncharacterized protein LOC135500954 n=1 Tax=Lineus longissimus TaxID=88925 RepID=UPI00315C93AB